MARTTRRQPDPSVDTHAVVYARISHDAGLEDPEAPDEGLGVQRQVDDCKELADRLGLTVVATYTDNDVSAAGRAKPRPQYEAMLAAVRDGGAGVIVAYSNSRLTRRPRELEDLIDLHNQTGVVIRTVVSGQDDLSTADGRMVARIKANVDAAEAERTSERVKRQKQQRLQAGMPPGSRYRTFGYTRDWQVIEDEATIVRDVFARVASGESVNAITNDLRARDLTTVSGKPWTFQATSRMLESPIYAGLLWYKGEVAGKSRVPALISEALYELAQSRQTKPAWNSRKHLLSGIATCDACQTAMSYSEGSYKCNRMLNGCGNVGIKARWLDDVVNAYMSSMVMSDARKKPIAPAEPKEDLVANIDRDIEAARQANAKGDLELADLLPILKDLRTKRAVAVKEQAAVVEEDAGWQPVADYDQADLSVKRSMVKRHIQAIMVRRAWPGYNKFDEHRCYVVRPDGTVVPLAAINVADLRGMIPGYPVFYSLADRGDPNYAEVRKTAEKDSPTSQ